MQVFSKRPPTKPPRDLPSTNGLQSLFMKSIPNKTPNRPPTDPHKTDVKKEDDRVIDIKDVFRGGGNVHNFNESSGSSFIKENSSPPEASEDRLMAWIDAYQFPDKKKIGDKTLLRWFKTYPPKEIYESLKYYEKMNEKEFKPKPEAYVEKSLINRYWEIDLLRTEAKEREKKYTKQNRG